MGDGILPMEKIALRFNMFDVHVWEVQGRAGKVSSGGLDFWGALESTCKQHHMISYITMFFLEVFCLHV